MTSRRRFLGLIGGAFAAGEVAAQLDPNIQALRAAALEAAGRKINGGQPGRPGEGKIHVLREKDPQPYAVRAFLGPRSGRASIATRARIADTGKVIAIAQLSDGSFWSDTVSVVVTLSACLEDGLI